MAWKLKKDKEEFVRTFSDKLKQNKNFVLTAYKGLKVREVTELRNAMRKAGCEFRVIKNTLSRIVMKNSGLDGAGGLIDGPTAIVLDRKDSVVAAKALFDFSKKNESIKIKGGVFNGEILDAAAMTRLAKLPAKEVVISQLAGTLNAPVSRLASGLKGILVKLACAVDAVAKKKK